MEVWHGWLVVIVMAIGTFAIRLSVLGGMNNRTFAPWVERALTLVLPAIFAAIVAPMIFLIDGSVQLAPTIPRLLAALVTIVTATVRRGYLLPLILGMLTLHLVQWLMQA